ncbi:MAG: hypothetical protein ISS66_02250 [Desulfobacteraceae bacterium]|nr:hypothetical protein [Desulfobacteraceae bacterium]
MNRNLLPIGLGLTIVLLALLLRDFVRGKIIIPFLKVVRFVDDLPQDLIWFFFIGIIVFFAYKTLIKWKMPGFKSRRTQVINPGQIEVLAELIRKANQGYYFRERLTQYLCDLTLKILAHRERLTPEIMKERLKSGTLDVPPEIMVYLQAGLIWDSPHHQKSEKTPLLDLDPKLVVQFLEHQLEYELEVSRDAKDR